MKEVLLTSFFSQSDAHSYRTRAFTLQYVVRKWGLICVQRDVGGVQCISFFFLFFFKDLFIYFRERGEAEGEGESLKQTLHPVGSPTWGSISRP